MRLLHRLTCLVRGHVPLESLPTEPPPARRSVFSTITGVSLLSPGMGYTSNSLGVMGNSQINVGPHNTPGLNNQTVTLGSQDRSLSVQRTGPVLQIDYPGASCKMSICARCQGVFWTHAPNLPALASSDNVPALKELYDWNRRESWEREQRENNEAAARLYKQYQMVLKLAGPTCDEVDE